jgi:hypothetical protein
MIASRDAPNASNTSAATMPVRSRPYVQWKYTGYASASPRVRNASAIEAVASKSAM